MKSLQKGRKRKSSWGVKLKMARLNEFSSHPQQKWDFCEKSISRKENELFPHVFTVIYFFSGLQSEEIKGWKKGRNEGRVLRVRMRGCLSSETLNERSTLFSPYFVRDVFFPHNYPRSLIPRLFFRKRWIFDWPENGEKSSWNFRSSEDLKKIFCNN